MPIYEFQCQACGNEIEVLQKISDPNPVDCEACGRPELKKKVTAAAFRLSGAGWYETDFKEGDNKKNLTDSSSDKKDTKKETKKNTDTKSKKTEKKETTAKKPDTKKTV